MIINLIEFNLSSIDKPTIVFVLVTEVAVVAILFLLHKLYNHYFPPTTNGTSKQEQTLFVSDHEGNFDTQDEEQAAIAVALYLHFNELHDEESNIITIQRVSKTYSPWSSKIYNMRNFR
jgi:glutaconyl-CoA/methylmalonyl-CoA decarboxylase subunit delta